MKASDKGKRLERLCPVCKYSFGEVLIHVKFFLYENHPLPSEYDVVACEHCNFVFADTPASQKDYNEYYALFSSYGHNASTGGEEKTWDKLRLSTVADYLKKFFPAKNTSFLDIGCAGGGLLRQLKDRGYTNLCGIDPSETCVKNTITNYEIPAYQGTIFSMPHVGKFDVVILSHTLEHIYDVRDAVAHLSMLLCEAGYLYIEVPDARQYANYITSPLQDFNVEHINHFSSISLENLILPLGFAKTDTFTKVDELPEGVPSPAISSLWEKQKNNAFDTFTLQQDQELKSSVNEYISKSLSALESINRHLMHYMEKYEQFIIWGTGQLAFQLLNYTCLKYAKIISFVDSNPINHGKILRGIPIDSPTSIRDSFPIIITTLGYDNEIQQQIKEMQLKNPVISLKR